MKNLLIDIGAHFGEALEETLRPIYNIDRVYAIEPSSVGIKKLQRFKDKRLKVYPIAVSNYNGEANLFSAGSVGGGLFSDKRRHWKNNEIVNVFKFSEWAFNSLNRKIANIDFPVPAPPCIKLTLAPSSNKQFKISLRLLICSLDNDL